MIWKIAHRGASGAYPENTMLAFRQAIRLGADALELDVHASKDGEAVVIHDATLKRTTNGKGRVADHTLAELKRLDAGRGERIPTLEEALAEFAAKTLLLVEIKSAAAAVPTGKLIARLARRGLPYRNMAVIGFHRQWLLAARQQDSRIPIGLTPSDKGPLRARFCADAAALGAWSVNPSIGRLNKKFIRSAREHGLKIITWTANTPRQIEKAKALGIDGIITDFPDRL